MVICRSRTVLNVKAVLEKPTIQYTETSRAKSSSVLGEEGGLSIWGINCANLSLCCSLHAALAQRRTLFSLPSRFPCPDRTFGCHNGASHARLHLQLLQALP